MSNAPKGINNYWADRSSEINLFTVLFSSIDRFLNLNFDGTTICSDMGHTLHWSLSVSCCFGFVLLFGAIGRPTLLK